MTDELFRERYLRLKRLGKLALVRFLVVAILSIVASGEALDTLMFRAIGAAAIFSILPVMLYLVLMTIWHWKSRYRGTHGDLWGALLVIETSGWFKIVYLFRHINPDARREGRYRIDVNGA